MGQQHPFQHPSEKSTIPATREITEVQQEKYNEVLKHFQELTELPVNKDKKGNESEEKSALTDSEKAWLTKECFFRYLRATKWHSDQCIKRIEGTLIWRRTFGVDPDSSLTPEAVAEENETGKQLILGFDNQSRPCLYLITGAQNTKSSHRQVQHLVFMLERVIDYMPPGQDQLALLIDFKSGKNGVKLPPMSIGREVLSILQDHYPERLGKALLTNIPWLGWTFLKLIQPFIDPLTREKLVFQEPFPKYVPSDQLRSEFGGTCDFEYVHDIYWPEMCAIAQKRRESYFAHFKRLGSKVGLSEFELRAPYSDEDESLSGSASDTLAVSNGTEEKLEDKLEGLTINQTEQIAVSVE